MRKPRRRKATGLLDLPPSDGPPADTHGRPLGIAGLSDAPADRTPAALEVTAADMFAARVEALVTVDVPNTAH